MTAAATQVAKIDPAPLAVTPMHMLDRAVSSGASIETLDKLMALQERWEANEARKAFNQAVSDAKAEMKPVVRNKSGHNSKRYADFEAIATSVDPILTKHGLSYRFRSEQTDRIHVTCVLAHKAGHSETTTLAGPADTSGNKNAIQAIGSTLTYLQRYSLVQMLGLAASDDDDANAAGAARITEAQADEIRALLETSGKDRAKFLKWANVPQIEDIPAAHFQSCIDAIKAPATKAK